MKLYVSIGGNAPSSCSLLRQLMDRLERDYTVVGISDIYTTRANDGVSPDYYNAVVCIESESAVKAVQDEFKAIEREMGRTPADKACGVVPIDIDIVVADGMVLRERDFGAEYFRIGFEGLITE